MEHDVVTDACSTGDGGTHAAAGWHAVLQLPNQLLVHRLKLLFDSGNTNIFPKGFAREAIEVGPASEQSGPCLLLLTFVSLSPQQFTEWQDRTCYDWVIQRIFWLPAVVPTAPGDAVRPYTTFTGPEALREAVRNTPMPPGADGGCGVRLQVYPRTEETAMAELLRDVVSLDLDTPQHLLAVVQWPSEPVATAAAALEACDADHVRLAKGHERVQRTSLRMAEELEAIAEALRAGGAVALTEAEMAAVQAAAGSAGTAGREAEGDVDGPTGRGEAAAEEAAEDRERTRGGDCSTAGGKKTKGKKRRGTAGGDGGGSGGGDRGVAVKPVPVVEAVAAIADPTERWRAATARAALERRRLEERETRRAAVVARCAVEREEKAAAQAAAQAVAEYSFGLIPAEGHYRYGSEREKKMPGQLCRAASKLREALITCTGSAALPPGLAAVDVGAAPGGWSQQLAAAGARLVVAIDPAEMDPAVATLPNLVHLRCKCEDAVSSGRLVAALETAGLGQVDFVVCDVNAHPADAAKMLAPVLPLLAPGGRLILTLKTFGRGRGKDSYGEELAERLGDGFEPGRLVWLLANTACERTYVACKRGAAT